MFQRRWPFTLLIGQSLVTRHSTNCQSMVRALNLAGRVEPDARCCHLDTSLMCLISVPCGLSVQEAAAEICLISWANSSSLHICNFWISGERERRAKGVLGNKELHIFTSPQTTTLTGREVKSKYPRGALPSMCFLFPVWLHSSPCTSAERSEPGPPLEEWKDKAQTWCVRSHAHALFNTSHRK